MTDKELIKSLQAENALIKSELESYKLKEKHNKEILQKATDELEKIKEEYLDATSKANIVRDEYKILVDELRDMKQQYTAEIKDLAINLSKERSKGIFARFK